MMPKNPTKVLECLKAANGAPLTLIEIAEETGIPLTSVRTEFIKYLSKYPEYKNIHRSKKGKSAAYEYSTNHTKPEPSLKGVTLAKIIGRDGEDVILKDDKGRIILGRYIK